MRRLAGQSRRVLNQQRCMSGAPSTAEAVQFPVPIEIVSAVSQRTHNVVQLPKEIEQVLGKHLGAGSKKGLRADSQALLQELRSRSRSTSRGGVNDLRPVQAFQEDRQLEYPQQKVRRRRHERWQDKVQLLTRPGPALDLAATVTIAERGTSAAAANSENADSWDEEPQQQGQEQAAPQYNAQQAAAYMAARMPACYAAVYKVLEEVSMRLPTFSPESMLDFGAGPGTAIWAAHEVYNGQPSSVLAVEPSLEMSRLGQRIQAARSQMLGKSNHASSRLDPRDIRWASSLPGMTASRSTRKQVPRYRGSRQQYDLVTAAYVLSELASNAERQQVIQELWSSTKGILVLVEPGTPSGYQYIIDAREQVLQEGYNEKTGLRESSVVAPCPHDGACPMQGTQSWCHFVQRFERSSLQRVTKVRQDGGLARTYQDERFSYVVLRRGGRKMAGASQPISRQTFDAAEMHDPQPYLDQHPRSWRKSEAHYQRLLALEDLMQEMGQFEDPKGESEVLEEATEYLIQQSIRAGDDEEDELDSSDEPDEPQISEAALAAAHLEGSTKHGKGEISVRSASATGDAVHDADLRTAELLQDSNMTALAAGVTAEDDSREADAIPSLSDTRAEEFELYDSRSSKELSITSLKADQEEQTERDWSEDLDVGMSQELNEEEDYDSDDSEEIMGPELSEERLAEMALATARQSSTWGRIIRPPRKKGRHIIVDLCTSLSALPKHRQAEVAASCQAAQGKKGMAEQDSAAEDCILLRQVLTAADKKTWLGPAGYTLARNSKWGDLWPSYYINRAIISKIEDKSL